MGGLPQYLRSGNTAFLKSLYTDIVFRDVIVRNGITAETALREMIYYLASNVTHPFTYNSVAKNIGVKSMETVELDILSRADIHGALPKQIHPQSGCTDTEPQETVLYRQCFGWAGGFQSQQKPGSVAGECSGYRIAASWSGFLLS